MASISIGEGRASRIADYTSQNRESTPRGPSTLRRSLAAARKGVDFRREMAQGLHGRVTHGGGGLHWGINNRSRNLKGNGAILDRPYSKIRAKRKGYKAPESPTPNWAKYVAPSERKIKKAAKRTGQQSKLKKGKSYR